MRALLPILVTTFALAGCSPPAQIAAEGAYVRLSAVPRNPAAAYFTLKGGPADVTLMSVESTVAIRSEMHESMKSGTMMSMKPIQPVPLPAHGEVKFAPGGKHVMLFDMNPGIKRGSKVPLLFTFTNGQRVRTNAIAIAAGDPPPAE
ncbi:copper chaperone PCu(A)C [Sphingomonas sp. GB1N7]